MTLYVQAKSKKAINEALKNGEEVRGTDYSERYPTHPALDKNIPIGTVIKVWEKMIGGSPYAKAYGTWDGNKVK